MSSPALPPAFADLVPFLEAWGLPNQKERYRKMVSAGIEDLQAFYDAVLPRVDAIVEHLNRFPVDDMPAREQALFNLALTFAEVAHPADFRWKTTEMPGLFPVDRISFTGPSMAW